MQSTSPTKIKDKINGIVSTVHKYTREEKDSRLKILDPSPIVKTSNKEEINAWNQLYAKQKLEMSIRRKMRKDHNIFQPNKAIIKSEKTPKKDICMDILTNTISPLSISNDLEPKFKLSPSMLKKNSLRSKVAFGGISESKTDSSIKTRRRKKEKISPEKAGSNRKKRERLLKKKYKEELKEKLEKLKDLEERIDILDHVASTKQQSLLDISKKVQRDLKRHKDMEIELSTSTFQLKKI